MTSTESPTNGADNSEATTDDATPLWLQGRDTVIAATPVEHWRAEVPDYHLSAEVMPRERLTSHEAGSLERIVEDLVQIFELEVSHRADPDTWISMATDRFRMRVNGGEWCTPQDIVDQGSYTVLIGDSPFYAKDEQTFDSSHDTFHAALPGGFFWEVLEVLSPPPNIAFTWRHWGRFEGEYEGHQPTGELIEMYGSTIARVNDELKLTEITHYYNSGDLLATMTGGCPVAHHQPASASANDGQG